jgi:hypothetical protein
MGDQRGKELSKRRNLGAGKEEEAMFIYTCCKGPVCIVYFPIPAVSHIGMCHVMATLTWKISGGSFHLFACT